MTAGLVRLAVAEVFLVNFQMVGLGERFAARLTAVRQLGRVVRRVVFGQLVEIAVVLAAHTAIERIVLLVHLHVVLYMALLDERLLADVAPVRTLAVVYADVVDKVDLLDEANATDQALVRPLAGVYFRVVRQGRRLYERLTAG